MDEKTVRLQLMEISEALRRNEEEHAVLVNLLKGFEGWLRLKGHTNGDRSHQLPMAQLPESLPRNQPKGELSLRGAILQVLKGARGEPLHVSEVWNRAQVLGAKSAAKNIHGVTDLVCHSLKKEGAERVAPRTWRWVGLPMSFDPGDAVEKIAKDEVK